VSSSDDPIEVIPLGNGRYQVTRGTKRTIAFAVTASVETLLLGTVLLIKLRRLSNTA